MGRTRNNAKRRGGNPQRGTKARSSLQLLALPKQETPSKNAKRKGNNSHRSRAATKVDERKQKYVEGGVYERSQKKVAERTLVIDLPVEFPDHFAPFNKGADLVNKKVKEWPTPADLPSITDDDTLTVLIKTRDPTPEQLAKFGPGGTGIWFNNKKFTDSTALTVLAKAGWPRYLIMRFGKVISIETQKKLLKFWDHLVSLGLKFPDPEPQRSTTPAVHLGAWGLYDGRPRITTDSRQEKISDPDKRAIVCGAMDKLLGVFKDEVVPPLENVMHRHAPEQTRVQSIVYQYVLKHLAKQFEHRPNLDFGGLFFSVACKEGSSEVIHIDWNDNLHKFALVFCVGDYVGGEFCAPQIGHRIPLQPGAVLAVRTRLLAHCATVVGRGRRLVFTCFTDSPLLERALVNADFAYV
ncbi:hypothetical protein B0H13DRAFT_2371993 [Mycena leptocephala]|nr:hypothetical protein B0H13DRAFT_2371993 [Mycena leptocephala]